MNISYILSKDYARLFELVQTQDVICVCNESNPMGTFRRFGLVRFNQHTQEFDFPDGWRCSNQLESLIDVCNKINLEFLDPGATEELAGALKKCIKALIGYRKMGFSKENLTIQKASELLKKYEVKHD